MFGTHDLLLFVLSGLALNVSPGPDTAYIVARSVQCGCKGGAMAALGVGTGCLVHVAAATLGLSVVLATSAAAFTAVKLAGAAYLIHIGVQALRAGASHAQAAESANPKLSTVFRQGFLTDALNPKVALFFLAFLPQFVDADAHSKAASFLLLGLIFTVNGTLWCVMVAWMAARAARLFSAPARFRKWINRAVGSLFIALGIKLAFAQSH